MFEIVFFIFLILYIILMVIITLGLNKKFPVLKEYNLPTISIIVAARNEEDNILECLVALDKQNYPADKIQIVIIDDKSTDKTKEIVIDYIKDKPKFICITTSEEIGHLKGKTNALANGIKIATGEIILTTDADCTPPENWAKTMASYFVNNVGVVCGFTTQQSYNAFSGMQAIDFCFLQSVAAGVMNLGKPITCIGNNMAFTKKAYLEVGGFESLEFSVTEDFKLLQAIVNTGKYKSIYPVEKDSLNVSKPCKDLKTLYWQKKRWGVGGLEAALEDFFIMAIGFVVSVMIILSPFFFSANLIWLIISKFIVDFVYLYPLFQKWNIVKTLKYFWAFEIYYIIYVILLPIVVLFSRKVVWKGRKY